MTKPINVFGPSIFESGMDIPTESEHLDNIQTYIDEYIHQVNSPYVKLTLILHFLDNLKSSLYMKRFLYEDEDLNVTLFKVEEGNIKIVFDFIKDNLNNILNEFYQDGYNPEKVSKVRNAFICHGYDYLDYGENQHRVLVIPYPIYQDFNKTHFCYLIIENDKYDINNDPRDHTRDNTYMTVLMNNQDKPQEKLIATIAVKELENDPH